MYISASINLQWDEVNPEFLWGKEFTKLRAESSHSQVGREG